MNKLAVFIFTIFVLTSCENKQESTLSNGKTAGNTIRDATESAGIIELDAATSRDIIGLWKLYKTVYQSGESIVESQNSFLELKNNNKYSANRYEGGWFLSFCKDSASIATLITLVSTWRGSDEAKIDVNRVEKLTENNTTYLKLTALTDGRQHYYIRQQ